jgi:hypothetical protein
MHQSRSIAGDLTFSPSSYNLAPIPALRIDNTMAYPGRHGQHYQNQNGGGGGGPPGQMPMPMSYNQGPGNYGPPQGQYGGAPQGPPPGQYGQPPMHYGNPGQVMQSDYQGQQVNMQKPQGQQMAPGGHPYAYSSMQGKRKALLIGINYIGTRSELRGCINDVHNVQNFLMQRAGYKPDDMVVLTDDARDPRSIPTRQNMTAAMHWLVSGAAPGDALFFRAYIGRKA